MISINQNHIQRLAPNAVMAYKIAFTKADELFAKFGINKTPLRLAHFMAQVLHETGDFTILEENLHYRAPRILEIFGVGKHSAKVTPEEAAKLAMNPEALAERVYGLGNPAKAKELGNRNPGDGYKFRGRASMQTTGGNAYAELSKIAGVDFVAHPELLNDPKYILFAAAVEWDKKGCNAIADSDTFTGEDEIDNPALRKNTKKVNGGYNGLRDRANKLKKTKAVWR